MPWVEQLIVSEERRGKGVAHDPIRTVCQIHRFDGTLLAELDPMAPGYSHLDGKWYRRSDTIVVNPKKNGKGDAQEQSLTAEELWVEPGAN